VIEHGFAVFLIWLCVAAFFVRVLSQVYVALYQPPWLPPMNEWYSGLIPYGVLLPAQILILLLMVVIAYDFTRADGFFCVTEPMSRSIITWLSAVYAASMTVRTLRRLAKYPLRPWYSGRSIPILLHFVLAFFLFLISGAR